MLQLDNNRILKFLLLFALISLFATPVNAENDCTLEDQEFLVTFHPHLDAFWLNTDDELKDINFRPAGFLYNMNQRNSKQIFNSMYDALLQDERRKYFISQIVFFKDWYQYLDAQKKQKVKAMLKSGQIDIANSGWVENDQAVCYYDDIIDQYTVGMNWMYEEFGYVNKIGWATDSFGHSHSQVAIQHLLGFQFQGIQRIDDRYIYQRKQKPLLEFYWQPVSDSNGRKYGGLANQVRHFLHEVNDLRNSPSNSISADFINLESNMKKLYGKNKLFRFLGNDFQEFNSQQFSNLQKSFDELNRRANNNKCPAFKYGNPKDYLETIKLYWSENKIQTRQFDFMSNWDQDRYWSGYYTTDPELKIICKWFSRLVNLVRKRMVKSQLHEPSVFPTHGQVLRKAEQLLSVMQHHDGITATSKSYIERLFKDRMVNSSKALIDVFQKIQSFSTQQVCRFFENKNTCKITSKQSKLTLSIFHEGVKKKQRIEITLPDNFIYSVENNSHDIIYSQSGKQRVLVFEAELRAGRNDFVLAGVQLSAYKKTINQYVDKGINYDNGEGVKISVINQNQIKYSFGQNHFSFSYQTSSSFPSSRKTVAWNKYGIRNDKVQNVQPGIYIMSNNGKLMQMPTKFKSIKVVDFGKYTRAFIDGDTIHVTLTYEKANPAALQYDFLFKPNGMSMVDYFLKVDSNVVNAQNQFYHDANGYLVVKRKIGSRPDYDWEYKVEDKINANTFAACSFIYQTNGEQKVIAFVDRALGVTTYDGSILINVDRLAGDDYKGVGEGYAFVRENNFKFRFSITSTKDDLERAWQRSYDQSLIGFISSKQATQNSGSSRQTEGISSNYLKYTLSFLNNDQILLRLNNLAEKNNIQLPKFGQKSWKIQDLNLDLNYSSIRESFANGIVFKERYNWVGDEEEINHLTRGSEDSKQSIVLRPLQIRSFRINLKGEIVDKQVGGSGKSTMDIGEPINPVSANKVVKGLVKHSLRKRCY